LTSLGAATNITTGDEDGILMTTYGKINEYQPEEEKITSYLERVDILFSANNFAEGKRVVVLLSVIGSKTYGTLCDLVAPERPQDKTSADLMQALKNHYEPKPLVIAERFHFYRRSQGATESVTEYVAQLRKLATHCEFGEFLSEALRDRLVCRLVSASTQKRLLSEANLTLAKAVEIAQGMEATERGAKTFHGEEGVSIGRIQSAGRPKGKQTPGGSPCSRCGGSGHHSGVCWFRTAVCHTCKKKGHLARVCRRGKNNRQNYLHRTGS
jgi:hypothetical protein